MLELVLLLAIMSIGLAISIAYAKKYKKIGEDKTRHNRELLRQKIDLDTALTLLRQSFEKEKELFSKTLHDEVGNSLASMKLIVDALGRNRYGGDFDMLLTMQKELDRCLFVVRNISKDAYPPSLMKYGLGVAISELCERVNNPKIFTKVYYKENSDSIRLTPDCELVLYRATQELVGNAQKHSLAWHATVTLQWEADELVITVEDNGVGYGTWKKDKGGMGLKSIRSSLKSINATISLDRDRTGFMAQIYFPLYHEAYQDLHSG